MTILAATRLEERAVRGAVKNSRARIVRTGIGGGGRFDEPVIVAGLAGGLRHGVGSGTVVIASEVARLDGERVACDPALVSRLVEAARQRGVTPLVAPIATSKHIVRGASRSWWSERGFAAVDMESGLIVAPQLAAVRVILDTPERELSAGWEKPFAFFNNPSMWLELPWLAMHAPRYARLAAEIVGTMLKTD